MLAITDGIPRYLEELNPSLSCKNKENLRRMCFVANAPLRVNFDDMFMDVITKQPRLSAKVIRALSSWHSSMGIQTPSSSTLYFRPKMQLMWRKANISISSFPCSTSLEWTDPFAHG